MTNGRRLRNGFTALNLWIRAKLTRVAINDLQREIWNLRLDIETARSFGRQDEPEFLRMSARLKEASELHTQLVEARS